MDVTVVNEKQSQLAKILSDLAQSEVVLKKSSNRSSMYRRLESVYIDSSGQNFRHLYSRIFGTLTQIKSENSASSIDVLSQNLLILVEGYMPCHNESSVDISDELLKLYDHVNLEIARLNYSEKMDRDHLNEDSLRDIKAQISIIESKTVELSNKTDELSNASGELSKLNKQMQEDTQNAKKEYIAILGIFASVVLAFTASITFSSSILENLHLSSIYRIVIITTLLGLVTINVLYAMFYYLEKIVKSKDKPSMTPLWISNATLVIILFVAIIMWYCGFVENRNQRLNDNVVITHEDLKTEDILADDYEIILPVSNDEYIADNSSS